MGAFDWLFGRNRDTATDEPSPGDTTSAVAIAEYERMLRTAPPDTVERIHLETFERLTSDQRENIFDRLTELATNDADKPLDPTPASLAAAATRAELHNPGTMREVLGYPGPGTEDDPRSTLDNGSLATFLAYDIFCTFALATVAWSAWSPIAAPATEGDAPDASPQDAFTGPDADGGFDGVFDVG